MCLSWRFQVSTSHLCKLHLVVSLNPAPVHLLKVRFKMSTEKFRKLEASVKLLLLFCLLCFLVFKILLREGCKKILVADSLSLLQKMHRTQMRGVRVDGGCSFLAFVQKQWKLNPFKLNSQNCCCWFYFSEENICESCHATILPSGRSFMLLYPSIVLLCHI